MRELNQIRDAVIGAFREAGLAAMASYPDQAAKQYDACPVAAVAVETAESRTVGFCNYLGEESDPETGQIRELYGKQLDAGSPRRSGAPGRRYARRDARQRQRCCWGSCRQGSGPGSSTGRASPGKTGRTVSCGGAISAARRFSWLRRRMKRHYFWISD